MHNRNLTWNCITAAGQSITMRLVFTLLAFSFSSLGWSADHYNDIPDFTQSDVKGSAAGNGQQYCAPVAVSNSLVWLNSNKGDQLQLIHQLASGPYMNTSLKNGTGVSGVTRGVARISQELFGGYRFLEYEGWRKHPGQYSTGKKRPSKERLLSAISPKSAAWLNIGWYKRNKANNEYRRIGGHWITLVGVKNGKLVLHDPAPRAGKSFANEFVSYSVLKRGTLVGKKSGLPFPAKGLISLGHGMHKKKGADLAIIDGVVYLGL
jgi:hypothetical protein